MKRKIKYAFKALIHRNDGLHNDCPSCGSKNYKQIAAREFLKFPTSLRHCDNCKLLYRHPVTLEEESKKFYENDYVQSGLTTDLPNKSSLQMLLDSNFIGSEKDCSKWFPLLQGISNKLNRKIRVLDYGANWGYTVHQFKTWDFIDEAVGFEYSDVRREFGQDKLKLRYISEAEFDNKFDVVFSSHVIEHMYNPSLFRTHMDRLLLSDGYTVVTCPNGSLTALFENPVGWRCHWGEVHPNFISDEYLIQQFRDYKGVVISEQDDCPADSKYLDHLQSPPVSCLPSRENLIGIFHSVKKLS